MALGLREGDRSASAYPADPDYDQMVTASGQRPSTLGEGKNMERPDLHEWVNSPQERPEVEYKRWLDLADRLTQAKTARHLCALANYGGGHLVFGIEDDGTTSGPRPVGGTGYGQDRLSGIVKHYLAPAFQVRVYEVKASTGVFHPVVWVPPLSTVPVCARRSGPDGKGISVGMHYTRGPGPASEPVTTPAAWAPIIRRCVMQDRQSLLVALDAILRSPAPAVDAENELRRWHEAARARFVAATSSDKDAALLERAHFVLSYRVGNAQGERLDMAGFVDELGKMSHETKQLVDSGWPMFVVFYEADLRPRSSSDESAGVEEFLECRFVGPERGRHSVPELWRAAPEGLGAVVRGYYVEDFAERDHGSSAAGQWLAQDWMARDLGELIRHACAFSERFETAGTVTFRAEWHGLAGRRVRDTRVPWTRGQYDVATDDEVAVTRTVGVAELVDGWPELVADMLSRALRVFNAGSSVSSGEITTWSADWRR